MITGCVDVGGGLRDIYGAGVFDCLIDNNIGFDYCIGVSAGSANCASFLANQKGRNKKFYLEYLLRKEAIGPRPFIKTGSLLDLEYVYGTLCEAEGENPLDYSAMLKSKTELTVVATDAVTAAPVYFDMRKDMAQNDYSILMASCCLPVFCKPIKINGRVYYDGGLSDPIPFKKLLEKGCDKIVIILTKPIEGELNQGRNALGAKMLRRKYPLFSESMEAASEVYNEQLSEALQLQEEGKAIIIAPDDIMGMGTLTRDFEKLEALYEKGYKDAKKIKEFMAE